MIQNRAQRGPSIHLGAQHGLQEGAAVLAAPPLATSLERCVSSTDTSFQGLST